MRMILRMIIAVMQHSWRGDFDCKDTYHQASSSIHREDISNARITIMKRPPAFVGRTFRVMTTIIVHQDCQIRNDYRDDNDNDEDCHDDDYDKP